MLTRSNTRIAGRHGGRMTALVVAMAALSVATLDFATAASAAGNAPRLVNPMGASPSREIAGYEATPTGGLASASVTFTVPKITCSVEDKGYVTQVYSGVFTDPLGAYAFVASYCKWGHAVYDWFYGTEFAGQFQEHGALPGDVVVASLFQSANSVVVKLHDLTQNLRRSARDNINFLHQGVAAIGTFANGNRVPTFTKVQFTNATVNGNYLGLYSPTRYNTLFGNDLLIKSSALATSGTGSSFSDTFKNAV